MSLLSLINPKPKYYISIYDCPIGTFESILKTLDYSKLCYEGKMKDSTLSDVWIKIYSEFIEVFGTPDTYKRYMALRVKWVTEQRKIWCNGQKYRESFAQIYKQEADEITKGVKDDFHKAIAYVSKEMRFRINPKEITVFEFYGYVKLLEKNGEEVRK